MRLNYDDIKHRVQPPLDCSTIGDLRGTYFYNRLITNYEHTDFSGCTLYHCYPRVFANALEINPAQSKADVSLKGADLQGADLFRAYLIGADIEGANFERANLGGATLKRANLGGANLQGADISNTNLEGANLENANLGVCDIQHVKFINANLVNADFRGARFFDVDFSGADIKGVKLSPKNLTEFLKYILKSEGVQNMDKIEVVEK